MALDHNGEFGNNDKFSHLKNETISVKEIRFITKFSLRHSNRIKKDVIKDLGKPPKYLLTFGEFLGAFHRINPEILINRFWESRYGK